MSDTICPNCGAASCPKTYTVDRYGIRHWFRQCAHCGHYWRVQHMEPILNNPFTSKLGPSWRPDPAPERRL